MAQPDRLPLVVGELAGKQAYTLVAGALAETGAAIVTRHVARGRTHIDSVASCY